MPYVTSERYGGGYFYKRNHCNCEREEENRAKEEAKERERARFLSMALYRAGLVGKYSSMTFDRLDVSEGMSEVIDVAKAFAQNPMQSPGLILQGPPGTGKTHIAAAIGNAILRGENTSRLAVRFLPLFSFLEILRAQYSNDGSESETAESIAKGAHILIIDDLGNERISPDSKGDWAREQVFQLIYWRDVINWPVIVTANYDVAAMGERLGMQTVSRLLGMCGKPHILKESDYRLKIAQKATRTY